MEQILLSSPDVGARERALLLDAFDSNWVAPQGPHVDAFEAELAARCGVAHAAALSSGTAGLHLALRILGVGTGDEVLCSTLTFVATANAITYDGAAPVFVDCDTATWQLDPDLLADALRDRAAAGRLPAAVIVVDLYGQCADYDRILPLCAEYGVPVIEDAAEAVGSTYRGTRAGAFGAMAVLSFNGNKIITCGGGGALLSDNCAAVEQARFLATQARDPAPHYEHSVVGHNYRLSNLLAAVGRGQLVGLDDKIMARRTTNARYREALGGLPGIAFMPIADYGDWNGWLTCITIDPAQLGVDREAIRLALVEQRIEARPVWKPMHAQPVFAGCDAVGGAVADDLFATGLCLPSGSNLTAADRGRVVAAIHAAIGGIQG